MTGRHRRPSSRRPLLAGVSLLVLVAGAAVYWGVVVHHQAVVAPTTSTTSTTVAPATTTTVPARTISFAAVGDTDLGNTPSLPAVPANEFAPVKALLKADITFGNLEGTMTTATTSKCGSNSSDCYAFRVPPSYAQVYRAAGFRVLNSANNHSYDFGAAGVAQTSAALRAAGIVQAGLPGQIGYVESHGIKVAFVDLAPYYLTNNFLVPSEVTSLIRTAHQHAQLVVVYLHAGAEGEAADHVTRESEFYYGENRGNPYVTAHQAIDDGADLVLASGPHVWRGMQWYRGHLIVYSMGDFTNYDAFSSSGDLALSGVVHVTLTASGHFVRGWVDPVVIQQGGLAVPDPTHALWSFVNGLSRSDFGTSAALLTSHGAIAGP